MHKSVFPPRQMRTLNRQPVNKTSQVQVTGHHFAFSGADLGIEMKSSDPVMALLLLCTFPVKSFVGNI